MSQTLPNVSPYPYLGPGSQPSLYPEGSTSPNLNLPLAPMSRAVSDALVILDTVLPVNIAGGASLLIIQAKLLAVNTTTVQSVSESVPTTTLYAVSLFMQSLGTGGAGHTVTATITYVSPSSATPLSITISMALSTANVVMETYPLLVAGGTSIALATSYSGGATNDTYTICAKLVSMP